MVIPSDPVTAQLVDVVSMDLLKQGFTSKNVTFV